MEDFSRKVGMGAFLLILMLVVMGYIPALSIGGIDLKRIDILSDIESLKPLVTTTPNEELHIPESITTLEFDEEEFEVDMLQVSASIAEARELVAMQSDEAIPSLATPAKTVDNGGLREEVIVSHIIDTTRLLSGTKLTPIENYDSLSNDAFVRLYAKLHNPNSTVRIAFLGDSFVEGDILTGDLREILQSRYGGCGAGFAPMDSPLTRYRKTVKTTSECWETFNVMQKRTTPESLASDYYVSGWVSRPTNGATTRWEGSDTRLNLEEWDESRILLMCRGEATIETSVNDAPYKSHTLTPKSIIQQIKISHEQTTSLKVKITSGADKIIGYGAIFDCGEGGGVSLDNYSVRSNNGQAMFWTNPSVNAQIDLLVGGYDLVILQYGLNIMQKGVNNYTRYSEQVEKMIAYVRQCFPHAAVLVMGVSDRSMKDNGEYKPMKEAIRFSEYQRQAAKNQGAAFWSTYDAMQAQGGMPTFVRNSWAGKDFTHINLAGGRQIAMALADALIFDHFDTCPPIIRKEYDNVTIENRDSITLDILK